jgi:hypothetical protein
MIPCHDECASGVLALEPNCASRPAYPRTYGATYANRTGKASAEPLAEVEAWIAEREKQVVDGRRGRGAVLPCRVVSAPRILRVASESRRKP